MCAVAASTEHQSEALTSLPPMCVTSDQDGAEPSANSVSASNLLRLSHYTGRQEWLHKSQRLLAAFSDRLTKVPIALPEMVRALMAQHYTLKQVIHLPPYFSPSLFHCFSRVGQTSSLGSTVNSELEKQMTSTIDDCLLNKHSPNRYLYIIFFIY